MGNTQFPAGSEGAFVGQFKEYRWWSIKRSDFAIKSFLYTNYVTIPATMVAYWRLDEKNDGSLT